MFQRIVKEKKKNRVRSKGKLFTFGYMLQWWIAAERVVASITVVANNNLVLFNNFISAKRRNFQLLSYFVIFGLTN